MNTKKSCHPIIKSFLFYLFFIHETLTHRFVEPVTLLANFIYVFYYLILFSEPLDIILGCIIIL